MEYLYGLLPPVIVLLAWALRRLERRVGALERQTEAVFGPDPIPAPDEAPGESGAGEHAGRDGASAARRSREMEEGIANILQYGPGGTGGGAL